MVPQPASTYKVENDDSIMLFGIPKFSFMTLKNIDDILYNNLQYKRYGVSTAVKFWADNENC